MTIELSSSATSEACLRQPSPPTSTSPLPPHFEQWPLPPQELQFPSLPYSEKVAPEAVPTPWHAGQFPSPGESQSMQVWVDMVSLPVISAILLAFGGDVKLKKEMQRSGFSARPPHCFNV
jgi:hypothetical protein